MNKNLEYIKLNNTFSIKPMFDAINSALQPKFKAIAEMHLEACVIAALCEGELSEIQAAELLDVDVVSLRQIKINVISRVIEDYNLTNKLKP